LQVELEKQLSDATNEREELKVICLCRKLVKKKKTEKNQEKQRKVLPCTIKPVLRGHL
jgi:hypothetical protein